MTILDIRLIPDPVRRKKAEEGVGPCDEIITLLDDMAETMYNAPGIGLAANQVGVLTRLIVIDCSTDEEEPNLLKMINPKIITSTNEKSELEEGCLSIPEHKANVVRPSKVEVSYKDLNGVTEKLKAEGLLSACLQNEIDHLNGTLFIDHISRLKRDMIIRKVKKQLRENEK